MPRLATSRRQVEVCAPRQAAHAAPHYARHAPERTLLYALVEAHYPDFIARIEAEDRSLPEYVREDAVTLIQRFGSALNLDVHFHMLWLDGVYEQDVEQPQRKPRLHRTRAPTSAQLTELADRIAHRICRHLTRKGWLEGEEESVFLSDGAASDDGMDALRMSSITYRIATGAQAGRQVVTLQTLPGDAGLLEGVAGKVGGFLLHAGVAAEAHESKKLEKLCLYITRPALSEKRLSISPQGRVRYQLKTPWRHGATHVKWDAVDFIAKLAALVPPPRAHLTQFHGVFAPNANLRAQLTPASDTLALQGLRVGYRPSVG